jgi:hypothetical protein
MTRAQRFIAGSGSRQKPVCPGGTTEKRPEMMVSVVPPGLSTEDRWAIVPSNELLGYYQTSLRDDEQRGTCV